MSFLFQPFSEMVMRNPKFGTLFSMLLAAALLSPQISKANISLPTDSVPQSIQLPLAALPPAPFPTRSQTERNSGTQWKLISFPITQASQLESILSETPSASSIQSIWKWDQQLGTAGEWRVSPQTGNFELLSEVLPHEGYWIRTSSDFQFSGSGVENHEYNLIEGWNLMGYSHSAQEISLANFFTTGSYWKNSCGKGEPVENVWGWKDGAWSIYFPNDADRIQFNQQYGVNFPALTTLEPGMGFWLKATRANLPSSQQACDPIPADLVLVNGTVYSNQSAEAVAVIDGRIRFIGSTADAQQYVGSQTQRIDLQGKMLVPGFIDNHNHVFEAGGGGHTNFCSLSVDLTLEEQENTLRACTTGVPEGEWITGYGHSLEVVLGEDFVPNNPLPLLDQIFQKNPIVFMEQTSHSMLVNSLAYAAANITTSTAHPNGGKIMKNDDGSLNGVVVDNAGDIVLELAMNSINNKFDVNYDGLLAGLEEVKKYGITTIGDGRMYWKRGWYEVWQEAESQGNLTARVSVRPWIYPELEKAEQITFLRTAYQNDLSRRLIINQVKLYSDGLVSNGTAKVLQPYTFTWFPESPNGINYISQSSMVDWLTELNTLGYGAHVHAIGDGAIRETLDAIETVRNAGSQQKYHMTHLELMDPAEVPRFATLKVDADIQLGRAHNSFAEKVAEFSPYIGSTRANQLRIYPIKELVAAGANVALSSDWNVNALSPLSAISNAMEEGAFTTVSQAIDAYTINPANALGLGSITGSIEVGKYADFAVLSQDISSSTAQAIRSSSIVMTILQGEVVYSP